MKTISQYREEIKSLMKKCTDIDTKAVAENREPTEAEISLKNEILDKVEEISKKVAVMERQEQTIARLETPEPSITAEIGGRVSIEVGEDRARRDRFSSFGEQMAAIMRAGLPGGSVDPRLFNAATGLNETVPSDGGFLVQQDYSQLLLQEIFDTAVIAPTCGEVNITTGSNSIKVPGVDETSRATGSRFGGIRGYWVDEADEKTASAPKFRRIELNLKKLVGLCYATDELLEDASALGGFIQQAFPNEFGFLLDDALINGSGAGQPLGVLNAGCLVTVAKEAGQAADTIVAENIVNMYSRMFASSLNRAVWYVNQNTLPQLYTMSLSVGTGGAPIFMPAGGLSASPHNTLLGRPVIPIEQCQSIGDVGDIIFADFKAGYMLAKKGGLQSDMSIHVRFVYDESVFRFVLRVDGQPVRASALTPFKGGATHTQSHFVALAAR